MTLPQPQYLNFLFYKTRTVTTGCIFQGCGGARMERQAWQRPECRCSRAHDVPPSAASLPARPHKQGQMGQAEERLRVREHARGGGGGQCGLSHASGEAKLSQAQERCHSQLSPGRARFSVLGLLPPTDQTSMALDLPICKATRLALPSSDRLPCLLRR